MTTEFKPFPFNPRQDARLLKMAGYTCTHFDADYEDIGGPESGPHVIGGPAYDVWTCGNHEIIVCEDVVVEAGSFPPGPEGWEDQF